VQKRAVNKRAKTKKITRASIQVLGAKRKIGNGRKTKLSSMAIKSARSHKRAPASDSVRVVIKTGRKERVKEANRFAETVRYADTDERCNAGYNEGFAEGFEVGHLRAYNRQL